MSKKMKKYERISGFTILELLVVIAIIAILIAASFTVYTNIKAKSRDTERIRNIQTLKYALAMYINANGVYPLANPAVIINGDDAVSGVLSGEGILKAKIADPLSDGDYQYIYLSSDQQTYTIIYYLETASIKGKAQGENTETPY